MPEILKILVNPRWRLNHHFGSSSKVKTHRNISVASMRRPAKFCRNRSSYAGDIKDFSKSLYPYTKSLSFTIGKTVIFNPVVWVRVWFWVNGTCLIPRPLCYLPGHIFRFFVSCTGPEEIVPVCTRGSERNNNNNNKTTMTPGEPLLFTNFVRPDVCESTSGHTD